MPSQKPININPANKGKLTAKVGKAGLKTAALSKTISKAKKSGNTTLEKQAVFAKNAKGWNHKGGGLPKPVGGY